MASVSSGHLKLVVVRSETFRGETKMRNESPWKKPCCPVSFVAFPFVRSPCLELAIKMKRDEARLSGSVWCDRTRQGVGMKRNETALSRCVSSVSFRFELPSLFDTVATRRISFGFVPTLPQTFIFSNLSAVIYQRTNPRQWY